LPISIVVNLLTREGRSRLVANLVTALALLLLLNRIALSPGEPLPLEAEPESSEQLPFEAPAAGPIERFVARVPSWSDDLAIVVLAVLVTGATVAILRWFHTRRKSIAPSAQERLAQGAQDGIDALRSGASVQDAVIRSYLRMSQVLREERGIERESAMTAHEFEEQLAQLGFPSGPVQELTHLFEQARYGSQLSGASEERRAVASLQAILAHCREVGGAQ
jgi:hypothetical protein